MKIIVVGCRGPGRGGVLRAGRVTSAFPEGLGGRGAGPGSQDHRRELTPGLLPWGLPLGILRRRVRLGGDGGRELTGGQDKQVGVWGGCCTWRAEDPDQARWGSSPWQRRRMRDCAQVRLLGDAGWGGH